jgi:hypothetical protein
VNSRGKSGNWAASAESLSRSITATEKVVNGRLYYGARFTTLKDRKKEIGPGLLRAMLDQLGLTKDDLEA